MGNVSEQIDYVMVNRTTIYYQPQNIRMKKDIIASEVPVALVYNGISHVVMMATPENLALFAIGFSLSEGIIQTEKEIYDIDIVTRDKGIEVHIELSSRCFIMLKERRRTLSGRTGCGICGTEQINEIYQPITPLAITQFLKLEQLNTALNGLSKYQLIGRETGCTHIAGWIDSHGQLIDACEDIGRHVALDKLLGLKSQKKWQNGAIIISSRASYEIVKKAATCGVEIVFAASAATSLAIDLAHEYNLTLVGFCRQDKAIIYTHSQRLIGNDD